MPEYPATTLSRNKGKYYVVVTIPSDLRQYFNGQKQLKRSTGTSDLGDAKRRQHRISTELYARLDASQPDMRDKISDFLGWIGDANEIQRLEDNGDLEGIIMSHKYMEDTSDPDDPDDSCIDLVHDGGEKALEVYREWKAKQAQTSAGLDSIRLSQASAEYLSTTPYNTLKTMQEAKHALKQFQGFAGDVALSQVDALTIHGFAEHIGKDKSKKTIQKKVGYARQMFDRGVRKGWVPSNVFYGIKLDPKLGKDTESYIPLSHDELEALFGQAMEPHLRRLLSILITTGMRLNEGALLEWEDVKYDRSQEVLYFDRVGARVKNRGSLRKVPVHPALT